MKTTGTRFEKRKKTIENRDMVYFENYEKNEVNELIKIWKRIRLS